MKAKAPPSFDSAVRELSLLPGIGEKTASRLAFHLLRQPPSRLEELGRAIMELGRETRQCRICHNLSHAELCAICSSPARTEAEICVVEIPQDLYRLEECCDFTGKYHVLGGRYAPLDGMFPEDLHLESLVRRIRNGETREVILAMNPNAEGEATCELIRQRLSPFRVSVTRLATGLPHGAEIDWVGRRALQDAFDHRRGL